MCISKRRGGLPKVHGDWSKVGTSYRSYRSSVEETQNQSRVGERRIEVVSLHVPRKSWVENRMSLECNDDVLHPQCMVDSGPHVLYRRPWEQKEDRVWASRFSARIARCCVVP
jgi:hypothetical protein